MNKYEDIENRIAALSLGELDQVIAQYQRDARMFRDEDLEYDRYRKHAYDIASAKAQACRLVLL